jgi:hypothetical protein
MKQLLLITIIAFLSFKNNLAANITKNPSLVPDLRPRLESNPQRPKTNAAPGINNAPNPSVPPRPNAPRNRRLQRLSHHTLNYNSPDIETQISSLSTVAERQLANARLRSARSRNNRENRRRRQFLSRQEVRYEQQQA